MSLEILYTSAPHGLRPGQHGFCTVAATDGIPRPLWERLEALSGYRHHFPAGATDPPNPVAWAHWLLNIGGKSHHVLSRIGDCGFDYTQRNNIFAHHLVLDGGELAPAGPAWMLRQAGTMHSAWDGQVGPIVRNVPLPGGTASAVRCAAWESAVGDAGWAGVAAEALSKGPSRPLCMIFSPGQDLLPLVDEVIRLLPPPLRWDVTFSTYFTSVPASAVCAWRCCLAGTPAAESAARYAAGGLVLDLTALPGTAPPQGPWITAARTGRPEVIRISAAAPTLLHMGGRKAPYPVNGDAAAAPVDKASPAASTSEPPSLPQGPGPGLPLTPALRRLVRRSSTAGSAGTATPASADRPWRRLALLYLGACLAIGVGAWLVVRSALLMGPPDFPPEPTTRPPALGPDSAAANRTSVATHRPPPPATNIALVPPPATQDTAEPQTVEAHAPLLGPPAPIELTQALDKPTTGSGLRDPQQAIALTGQPDTAPLARLWLELPGGKSQYVYAAPELSGTLTMAPRQSMDRPGFVLRWNDRIGPAAATDVLTVQMDKIKGQLDFTWRATTVLRRPDLVSLAFYLVRGSPMVAADAAGGVPRALRFPAAPPPTLDLRQGGQIPLPMDAPPGTRLTVHNLPAGWTARVVPVEPAQPGGKGATALELTRAGADGRPLMLTITFAPGLTSYESHLAARVAATKVELERVEEELRTIDAELQRLVVDCERDIADYEQRLAQYPAELNRARENRRAGLAEARRALDLRRAEPQRTADAYRAALAGYDELEGFDVVLRLTSASPAEPSHDVVIATLRAGVR